MGSRPSCRRNRRSDPRGRRRANTSARDTDDPYMPPICAMRVWRQSKLQAGSKTRPTHEVSASGGVDDDVDADGVAAFPRVGDVGVYGSSALIKRWRESSMPR